MNEVAKNILIRAGIIDGDKNTLRVGILAAGGTQTGAFSGGVLYHMIDLGLSDKLDVAVGISASAPNITHFLAKNKTAISVYWEDNIKGLIHPWHFWKAVDLDYLDSSFRKRTPSNIVSVMRNNPTEFYVGVTKVNGKGELINVKEAKDIVDPIMASCSLPILGGKPRNINGELYLDGGISLPLPVKEIAKKFSLTDLLVIINSTPEIFTEEHSLAEKIEAEYDLKNFGEDFAKAFSGQKKVAEESLALTSTGVLPNGCRVAVISPTYNISKICTDVKTLKEFSEEGKRIAKSFFSI
ncbi:MAG TPA: patatin-like phospholipase family protein [Candidatus Paceibacterota bacterium]|jgi:predicted patatin/cPLA2 family phospholipase|nr:patatin-like phospholipase family protein [Candidatus Paceibacterota bacterium]